MTGMVPEDVFELTGVTDPRLSPDGTTVAYVVGGVDAKANDYRGAIWMAPADGGGRARPARALPRGISRADPLGQSGSPGAAFSDRAGVVRPVPEGLTRPPRNRVL